MAVEGQPLAANVQRLITTLDYLGQPLPPELVGELEEAVKNRDGERLQELLDPRVLAVVALNPEVRVKVTRGPAEARLQQAGFMPFLVKVLNLSTVARPLNLTSPQAGPVYAGATERTLERQDQVDLQRNPNERNATDRFLDLEIYNGQPMSRTLSGLEVEYSIALVYSSEAGQREATLAFDVGAGTQDLGFRAELPVLFHVDPAVPVVTRIRDQDGTPSAARITIRDADGRVYPPQVKRLAPDFFFQPQIYRLDGQPILLPPGKFTVTSSRGPEYVDQEQELVVPEPASGGSEPVTLPIQLRRWVDPTQFGFYCGDHHIHGAGCSHYESPTQGVTPRDMFAQVKGEGLNVGCVLTWGPCFDFQRQYFSPKADLLSEPLTVMKYDLEISGFGSAALGHVCLLNLRDQTYPGSNGTKTQGWPTWTVPALRWAKEQGGVTGYPHSAMLPVPEKAAERLLEVYDADRDQHLDSNEASRAMLPATADQIDGDGDGRLSGRELEKATNVAADTLPNLALPGMDGSGAMEIFVSTAEGVCDFISAMDTSRIPEWNTWYHLMNCGFPLKLSGETDFPCMSSRRVGQGRVYVRLGQRESLDFTEWCHALRDGRSYVSDGYSHALDFSVQGQRPGDADVSLEGPADVQLAAKVAFAPEIPVGVAYGTRVPPSGPRMTGDTITLHGPRDTGVVRGGTRLVEVVVNGQVAGKFDIPANGKVHDVVMSLRVARSSWVALRQFPQMHTNPVRVLVGGKPIRASKASARWCAECVTLLRKNRQSFIAEAERAEAKQAYERAEAKFLQIADESLE